MACVRQTLFTFRRRVLSFSVRRYVCTRRNDDKYLKKKKHISRPSSYRRNREEESERRWRGIRKKYSSVSHVEIDRRPCVRLPTVFWSVVGAPGQLRRFYLSFFYFSRSPVWETSIVFIIISAPADDLSYTNHYYCQSACMRPTSFSRILWSRQLLLFYCCVVVCGVASWVCAVVFWVFSFTTCRAVRTKSVSKEKRLPAVI